MIVILAGAGASRAVSADKYPDTVEFLKRLPNYVTSSPWFKLVMEYLRQAHGENIVDIEHVLGAIQSIENTTREFYDKSGPTAYVFSAKRTNAITQGYPDFDAMVAGLREATKQFTSLAGNINSVVYDLYATQPEKSELQDNWLALFEMLQGSHTGTTELFTTNYDLVIEEAVSTSGIQIETGRARHGQLTRFDLSLWKTQAEDRTKGLFTKLHGSVDWQRGRGSDHIYYGNDTFSGQHSNQAILYPALKDEPSSEPFQTFHRHFEESVEAATAVIVIGFAFRDPAINRVLRDLRRASTPLVVIDPGEPLLRFPNWKGHNESIAAGFDTYSARYAVDFAVGWMKKYRTAQKE